MEKIGAELFLWCDALKLAFIDFCCFSPQSQSGTFLLRLKSFLETYTIFPCTKFFYHHFLFDPRRISNSCNQKIVTDTYPLPQVSSPYRWFSNFYLQPRTLLWALLLFPFTYWTFPKHLKFNMSKTELMVYISSLSLFASWRHHPSVKWVRSQGVDTFHTFLVEYPVYQEVFFNFTT